jgi:hypothetical protein
MFTSQWPSASLVKLRHSQTRTFETHVQRQQSLYTTLLEDMACNIEIPRPTSSDESDSGSAKIEGFKVVASYNWLNKPTPTILVPGQPAGFHIHSSYTKQSPTRRPTGMEPAITASDFQERHWPTLRQPKCRSHPGIAFEAFHSRCPDHATRFRLFKH